MHSFTDKTGKIVLNKIKLHWDFCSCFFKKKCIRIYSLYGGDSYGGQFQLDLYCTLFTLSPPSLPYNPHPTLLKVVARGFLVLFHTGI
jgi:hypothetical protein